MNLYRGRWYNIFNNQKFITSGVANTIPELLQIIMWELINNLPVDSKDYLQVFLYYDKKHKSDDKFR